LHIYVTTFYVNECENKDDDDDDDDDGDDYMQLKQCTDGRKSIDQLYSP